MSGDVEVDNSPTLVAKNEKAEEDPEGRGWEGEEVDCSDATDVVLEEGSPGLRRRLVPLRVCSR